MRTNPFQLIIKYPIITPRIPYRQVDAPAFTDYLQQSAEKILPAIEDTTQKTIHLIVPKLYQNLDSRITVLVKLPKKCIKFTCKTAAVISLHTCPCLIRIGQLAPIMINVSPFIYSNYPLFCRPIAAYAINTAIYTMRMKVVKESHRNTGQHISLSISKQCQSLGFLTLRRPDRNNTLCVSTALRCQMVRPSKLPSLPNMF